MEINHLVHTLLNNYSIIKNLIFILPNKPLVIFHNMDQESTCYICLGDHTEKGGFVDSACICTGTNKIHVLCIIQQINNGFKICGACKTVFHPKCNGMPIWGTMSEKKARNKDIKYIEVYQYKGTIRYMRHGYSIKWNVSVDPEVIIKQEYYIDGRMNGEFIEWSEFKGKFYISKKTNYSNGLLHGSVASFYANGVEESIATYDKNNKHGLFVRRYENNNIMQKCNYVNGKIEGQFESYYPNGKVDTICTYVKNKLHGTFKKWKTNGSLHIECVYNHGKPVPVVMTTTLIDDEAPLPAMTAAVPRTHTFTIGKIIARRNSFA